MVYYLVELGDGEDLRALVGHAQCAEDRAGRVEAVVGETEEKSDEQGQLETVIETSSL